MTEIPAFPITRTCPYAPPEEYAELRAERPITQVRLPTGMTAWLVTRHEHVRSLLADPRVSAGLDHPNLPMMAPLPKKAREQFRPIAGSLKALDPPQHTRHRQLLIAEFTVRRAQEMRPRIEQIVDEHVAELLAGPKPADLVAGLSQPVPSIVLCELFGVPYEDHGFFKRRSMSILRHTASGEERGRALTELREYLDELVTAKEAAPDDDLLGRLIVNNREARVYSHELLVGLVCQFLLGGHELTANMISLGIVGLLENPAQRARALADPAALSAAVDEMLRYYSVVDGTPRVALDDIEIGGATIRKDDGIMLSFVAANHDEAAFGDAERLRLDRGSRKHVAFGHGIHQCLGQNLARLELEVAFTRLFERIPGLRLATSVAELPYKVDTAVYGLYELPVTW